MFVGDSLNRNQWESMICLVQSVVPQGKKSLSKNGSLSIFTIEVRVFPSLLYFFSHQFESLLRKCPRYLFFYEKGYG